MGLLKIEGVTHWSIPVNNLEESEAFYGDLLGLEPKGRLGNSRISCFSGAPLEHPVKLSNVTRLLLTLALANPKM